LSHVGLKAKLLHSIKCDEGKKYERYFSITFLPPRGDLEACVAVGCLEVSKIEKGKEFYNPSKFYDVQTFEQVLMHLLAVFSAFKAYKYDRQPHEMFHQTFNKLFSERPKIAELTEKYYKIMKGGGLDAFQDS
jgi:hypothetical protein